MKTHRTRAVALFLVLVAPFFAGVLRADGVDAALDSANRAYQDHHYDAAAQQFQDLIQTEGYSAPLCFDLANAEFKAGHVGLALLNYERARYLAPGDEGIEHNLQLARKAAGLEPDPYRWWQIVLRSINWTVWMTVIVLCLLLVAAAALGRSSLPAWSARTGISENLLRSWCKGIVFVCIPAFLFFGFVELSAIGLNDRVEAIIVTKDAALRLSPFASAEQTGTVPEGELVTVEQQHNDFFWIDEQSRQSGWIAAQQIEPVVPGMLAGSK